MMWNFVGLSISSIVPLIGLFFTWTSWRKRQLMIDDVVAWSNDVIRSLETLVIICRYSGDRLPAQIVEVKANDLVFDTAILVERGRMFFKNEPANGYGAHKEAAYQGRRLLVLDQIVIAHKIAVRLPGASPDNRIRMQCVAESALKKFVSLIQKEVGRRQTAVKGSQISGNRVDIDRLLSNVSEEQIAVARRQ